jgi:DNA polymerase phi
VFEDQAEQDDEEMLDIEGSDDGDVAEVHDPESASSAEQSEDDDAFDEPSDGGSEDEDEQAEFNAKLAEALGTHRGDLPSDADSDADMDDDEMEAIDEQLAKVFRARNQAAVKKKDKKDAKETMINFKNRVLDLLEIYVKKCHSSILALELIIPLLEIMRKSKVKQISARVNTVLREYTRLCKGPSIPAVESESAIWGLLKAVHQEATHSGPPAHASSCSQTSLVLVKILVAHDKGTVSGIVDIYSASRKQQLLSTKCHIQPSFFSDWNNWCVSASKQLKG